jgi:hypothetical protein
MNRRRQAWACNFGDVGLAEKINKKIAECTYSFDDHKSITGIN